jgi:lysophospholipid acyltransferase (LPLAT)-like uncharacterized protein
LKKLLRNALRNSWVQRAVGFLTAEYLRLVWLTNKFSFDPADVYEIVEPQMPAILAFWHGQHFLTPFIKTKESHRGKVLISRHRDGEFNAIAVERLGIGTIRGSGDHGGAFHRKGGVGAFREMVQALAEGYNVASTADVPKRARVAGMGIIMLARESGRPIMPFAMATSRFVRLRNWDSTTINLPFGRGALVGIASVHVPPDADAETMERLRLQLETYLNEATRLAYEKLGRAEASPAEASPAKASPSKASLPKKSLPEQSLSEKSLPENKSLG